MTVDGAGVTSQGEEVFLRDVWPSREEVRQIEEDAVIAAIFRELKERSKVSAPSLLHPVKSENTATLNIMRNINCFIIIDFLSEPPGDTPEDRGIDR